MNDKDYLRQRLKELDKIRKAKGIERPNFSELNDSENLDNSNSSKKSNDNNNIKFDSKSSINSKFNDGLNLNNSSNLKNQNSTQTQNNKTSNERDYDKEPIIIKDYSYFFGVSLRYFSLFVGITIVLFIVSITIKPIREINEIWFILAPIILPLIMAFYDYYAYVIRDDYKLCFKNSSVSYMLDGKLERKVDIKEIPNFLLKPFWKNRLDIQSIIIVLVILTFIFGYLLISLTEPIPIEIYCFTTLFFISQMLANIIFKAFLYLWLNRSLSGFRIFHILIIAEPINPKEWTDSKWFEAKQRYYFIYFYNEEIYNEVRGYFLQNLSIDIDKTKKLITF